MLTAILTIICLYVLQGGNIEKATDWIFTHPEEMDPAPTEATSSTPMAVDPGVPDGSGS